MALVPRGNGSGYFLSLSLTDTQGDVSTLRFELRGADFATASTNATAVIAGITGVTQSIVSSVAISFVRDEDTFVFPTGADNGVRARMTFQLANSVEKATLDIPAPENNIFTAPFGPNNNVVDLTNAEVIAYAQLFQVGGASYISDGEDSDFVLRGKRTTK